MAALGIPLEKGGSSDDGQRVLDGARLPPAASGGAGAPEDLWSLRGGGRHERLQRHERLHPAGGAGQVRVRLRGDGAASSRGQPAAPQGHRGGPARGHPGAGHQQQLPQRRHRRHHVRRRLRQGHRRPGGGRRRPGRGGAPLPRLAGVRRRRGALRRGQRGPRSAESPHQLRRRACASGGHHPGG